MASPVKRRAKRRAVPEPLPPDVADEPITIGMLNDLVGLLMQQVADRVSKTIAAEVAVVLQSQRDLLALMKQQDTAHSRAVRRLHGLVLAASPATFGLRFEGLRKLDVLDSEEARDPAPDLSGMHDLREQTNFVARRVDGAIRRSGP